MDKKLSEKTPFGLPWNMLKILFQVNPKNMKSEANHDFTRSQNTGDRGKGINLGVVRPLILRPSNSVGYDYY